MRFKKGSKVEVLSRNDWSYGVWRCAEILSGNGHTFNVMFDYIPQNNNEDLVAKVSVKAIRPCPPPLDDLSNSWTPGDLVEVFEDFSWKTAAILKVFSPVHYLVKLIGSSRELRLHRVDIRVRHLWQDGEWTVIGKTSRSVEYSKTNRLPALSSYMKTSNPMLEAETAENCLTVENTTGFQESCIMTDRTRKRASPFWSSIRKNSKFRAIDKKGKRREVISGCSASFPKKVDAVVLPQECFGEMYMCTSPSNQTIASYEWGRGRTNYCAESFHTRRLEPNESDIDQCSVASCSVISNSPSKLCSPATAGNSCGEDSNAESFYGRGDVERECYPSVGVNVAVRIHSLELQAYRSTLEALYASGPLNWAQEVLLTNLRMSLNISNDEHLLELRNLIAPGTSIHIR